VTDKKMFFCKICSRTWDVIPADAERFITHHRGGRIGSLYRFPDASVHLIVKKALSAEATKESYEKQI
jgi:hypothetical protein